jgi:hypothetical protein
MIIPWRLRNVIANVHHDRPKGDHRHQEEKNTFECCLNRVFQSPTPVLVEVFEV